MDAVLALCLWESKTQVLVHVLSEEGCEGRHCFGKCKQHLEQDVQCDLCISVTGLQATAVETHVPVGQLSNERDETWYYSV